MNVWRSLFRALWHPAPPDEITLMMEAARDRMNAVDQRKQNLRDAETLGPALENMMEGKGE